MGREARGGAAPLGSAPRRPRRLRIGYVYRSFNRNGSIEALYLRHAERLARDEHVTLICSAAARETTAAPLRFETVEPITRGRGRLRYALECASFAVRATRAIGRLRENFDVVHVEGSAALQADLVTVHAVRPAEVEHYFSRVEPDAWLRRRLSPYLFRPQSGVVMWIERSLFRDGPPLCISPSRQVRHDLERWYGVPSDLIEVIPYGVETPRFRHDPLDRARRRAELGFPEERLALLFVGEDLERKGLGRGIAGLARSRTDAELWVMSGRDPAPYRDLASRLGVADRVRFLGRRPQEELRSWYSACDVVLLPSRQDTWALPVVEGMAAGRVVVVSEYAGSHEAIEHGLTGYVLEESGSPHEIAALLDGPLADPETRAAMMERAARAAARFDYEALYARFHEAHHRAYELRLSRSSRRAAFQNPLARAPVKKGPSDLAIFGGSPAFEEKLHVGRPNIGDRERVLERIGRVLDGRWLTNDGPCVRELERKIADMLGVRHCIATCSGTMALELAVRAAGLTGEVIVPSMTFVATAHALRWQGLTPVFADIDPRTHNLDPSRVEQLITSRTTGIVGVHLWGRPCEVERLAEIAGRHRLQVLYDAAHAFGCSHKGRMVGGFGRAEVFSFHATKFFHTLEGGAVVTDDDDLAAKVRLMRNFGLAGRDSVVSIGTNGKMNEVSAAVGLTLLESLDELIAVNYRHYKLYQRELAGVPGIQLLAYDERERCNYQYIVLEVDEDLTSLSRDRLVDVLWAENVMARRYFYPGCHRMEPYRSSCPGAGLLLPETERMARRTLCLPTGTAVRSDQVRQMCEIILVALACPEAASPRTAATR